MIREDRQLMVELERVTKQVVQFTLGVLGADPVSTEAQRDLGQRLIDTGTRLRDRAAAGDVINSYINGTVLPGPVIEVPSHD